MRRSGAILLLVLVWCLPASAVAAAPPSIVNAPPSDIRNREATAHFSIDPEGLATTYYVEYGKTASYGQKAGIYDEKVPAGEDPVARSAVLSIWGLKPATTYHYRVVATNSAGTTYGEDREVTTTDEPAPAVVTGVATDQTESSVTLRGTIDPEGLPVTVCRFHYVTQGQYDRFGFTYGIGPIPMPMGIIVPCEETPAEIGSGSEPVAVHANLSGYVPGAHQFRLEAENAYDEAAPGKTSPFGVPTIRLPEAGSISATTATVRALLERDKGSVVTYRFEYGRTDDYGRKTKKVEVGPGLPQPTAAAELTRLQPGTEYHYRVVVTNEVGTAYGEDSTFTTAGEPGGSGFVTHAVVMPPPEVAAVVPPAAAAPTAKPKAKQAVKKPRKQRKKAKRAQQRRSKASAAR